MYNIAIIGDRASVLGFMAIGFSVHEAEDAATATRLLHTLAAEERFAVIFVIESLAREMGEAIAYYQDRPLPAVITIPGVTGSDGSGLAALRAATERAVGRALDA